MLAVPSEPRRPAGDIGEVSLLLHRWAAGDQAAFETLMPLVYGELRRLAGAYMRRERSDHTLQATALVHEAYFRLAGQERVAWQDRAHFYAIAAQAMRRILVDHARRLAARQGAGNRLPVELAAGLTVDEGEGLLEVHAALERLATLSERQARTVELRLFGGLTVAETAEALGVSVPTAVREWRFARAWLRRELATTGGAP
jgi:RNA polymerase sigma factor (TIGR02999 family)